MATVKFSDIVKNYEDYNTSGEFSIWVEKLELVAQLQGITEKLKFLPLFLSGPAFAVYQQLSTETKGDYDTLKQELTTAFSTNPFASYEQLRNRVLVDGESVDVYLADLRRLVNLMGQKDANALLRCAFVAGLPSEIAMQLRSTANISQMELADIVTKARAMLATSAPSTTYACAGINYNSNSNSKPKQCYNCKGFGHIARECSSKQLTNMGQKQSVRKCYICDSAEHLANRCSKRSGNGRGGASASDARPDGQQ